MLQKIIKVGNSYAVTIPKGFADEVKWQVGKQVKIETNTLSETLTISPPQKQVKSEGITPEFYTWLKGFNARYKDVLTELAKK